MLLDGERVSGQDVRTQNVTAAMVLNNFINFFKIKNIINNGM